MLIRTQYTVDPDLIKEAVSQLPSTDFRTSINKPTGNFFYDPWVIKDEFKNTVWARILDSIKEPVGEARVIILNPRMSYHAHADIDDRFHLNISNEMSYLIDLENNGLHKLETDNTWYYMDAGRLHTASNFGRFDRVQLVVRKNLFRAELSDAVTVTILSNIPTLDDSRFMFDNTVSTWLNRANKRRIIDNFEYTPTHVKFDIAKACLEELKAVLGNNFRIEQ